MLLNRKPVPGYTPASAAYIPPSYDPSLQSRYPTEQHITHSRSRTNSSTVIPPNMSHPGVMPPAAYGMPQQLAPHMHPQAAQYADRAGQRHPSSAASFTSSSNVHNPNLAPGSQRTSTMSGYSTVSDVRRSTSSRSNSSSASPSSYVALMRKQKATVWCDRAQLEDPRILAAQRQAKMRAVAEVAGGNHAQSRVSTSSAGMVGGVRSKIRHHGAPKASAYTGANLAGAVGVPMRLSASEVDENDSDDDQSSTGRRYHSRTGSGRSSLGSGRKNTFSNSQLHHTYSHGDSPPQTLHSPIESRTTTLESSSSDANPGHHDWPRRESTTEEQTPMPRDTEDYFAPHGDHGKGDSSGGSGNSFSEETFDTLSGLSQNHKGRLAPPEEQIARKLVSADELRRRGSVDDRTTTMTGAGRLFVANPDLDD